MAITLEATKRDALFRQITADFTACGDLERAVEQGDEEQCYILGRRLSDGLRLLLDGGMGWQEQTAGPTVIALPDEELLGVMGRLQDRMVALCEALRPEREEAQAEWDEIAAVRDSCAEVMRQVRDGRQAGAAK